MTVTGKARTAGVMGWPIAHSRSPLIHGHWLQRYGVDGVYTPFAVRPEDGADAMRALPKLGLAGTNVTLPHKRTAFETVDRLDAAAKAIGAVNTIVVGEDGALEGSNTDAHGMLAHLEASAPDWRANAGPVGILGAGGSTRAALFALLDAGAPEIRLSNRTRARAEALAEEFGAKVRVVAWEERSAMLGDVNLLLNTTSLGMAGQPSLDIALDDLPASAVVYDIVYTPLETPLLADAREKGCDVVDGLGMLLHQAKPGFAAWFGVEPTVDAELRDVIVRDLR